ncbi:MAG: energy transducer TonB [Bacteroidia bacterium]|nr:energy transducer TonB [Bacteroidia bacterium]NND50885.1 energy transducer TonB [Flavobacteriaceae bacterium]
MLKYFKTKHEKDSARLTTLIAVILLLLIFIVGPKYIDPPEEYGIAVNFGTTDFGSGKIQPKKPIKSEPLDINKQPNVQESQPEAATPQANKEEVLTEDNAESIAMKKQKEAEARKKAEAEAKAKAEAERIERERKEQEAKKKKLDDMIGGIGKSDGSESGSEGNDDKAGDKGQLDGDPYAPSYFGQPGSGSGGVGYGLNGRGRPTFKPQQQDCFEYGMVVVKIEVNRQGNVIKASPGERGTTNNAACLLTPAKKIAESFKWPPDSNAPQRQIGFVSINFTNQ